MANVKPSGRFRIWIGYRSP